GKYDATITASVVECVSCTGSPPSTGTANALNTPVSSLLTRILLPSGENDAPRTVVVPRNSSIVYCRTSRGRSSAGAPAHAARRASVARSAGARVPAFMLDLPVDVNPVALCAGLRTAVLPVGFPAGSRGHPSSLTRRVLGSRRAAKFLLTRRRGERGVCAGPGCVRRGAERSSPGSTFLVT